MQRDSCPDVTGSYDVVIEHHTSTWADIKDYMSHGLDVYDYLWMSTTLLVVWLAGSVLLRYDMYLDFMLVMVMLAAAITMSTSARFDLQDEKTSTNT